MAGDRLYPWKGSRLYWQLTSLRREYENLIAEYFVGKRYGALVDFGCGSMPYRPLFAPYVSQYLGCDLPGNEIADLVIERPNEIPLPDAAAAIVLSSQVLEHVSDPAVYLREAHRVLQEDGILVLSTHGVWKYHPQPCDFWRWTCDGLKLQVRGQGFDILRFKGVMGPKAAALQLLQLLQDATLQRVPEALRHLYCRYMQWRMRCADHRCTENSRNKDAAVYVLLAKKRATNAPTEASLP